jgi:AraC-like DNA-binding protein
VGPSTISLDQNHTIFDGHLGQLKEHSHAVIALLFGLERPFDLWTSDGQRSVRFALVPAAVNHQLNFFGARTLVLYVEPHDPAYAALHRRAQGLCLETEILSPAFVDGLEQWQQHQDPGHILRAVEAMYATDAPPLDERVVRLAAAFNQGLLLNAEMDEMSHHVASSPSRLQHVLKAELGVGIRRLKQHYRFKIAVATVAAGGSLTVAAHRAGFSDSAHLSRAFSETFGLNPAKVLIRSVNWLVAPSLRNSDSMKAVV